MPLLIEIGVKGLRVTPPPLSSPITGTKVAQSMCVDFMQFVLAYKAYSALALSLTIFSAIPGLSLLSLRTPRSAKSSVALSAWP